MPHGVANRADAWSVILLSDNRKHLAPILAASKIGQKVLPDVSQADKHRLRNTAHLHIADAVVAVRGISDPLRAAALAAATPRRRARRR
jgi:hypothetical protein